MWREVILVAAIALFSTAVSAGRSVPSPPLRERGEFYVYNREPLAPTSLAKLPIGAIKPDGWLEQQLLLMAKGFVGQLHSVSNFLSDESGWLDPAKPGWEELPYWLKGYGDMAYILGSRQMTRETDRWLDAIFASQQPDGYFGPEANKANRDLWPNMVVLYALQSLYEARADERVIPFMTRYFRWQNSLPLDDLLPESWQKVRAGDNLESVYWLYNRTGEPWLLELAKKLHERTVSWTQSIQSQHGMNFCQAFRQPAVFWQQSRDPKHLRATEQRYLEMRGEFGQVPGGMFGADENTRPGKTGAQQAAETCSMVEFMNSFQSLLRITGDASYADKCEEVAFNSFPPSVSPDWRGLHYLTAPNQVPLHRGPENAWQNQGKMASYAAHEYRCCQHNIAQGWPYYAEHLWMAARGNGLTAVLYAPCSVTAKVGDGTDVTITEDTQYPFGEEVRFRIATPAQVEFPLYLRIPGWCRSASVTVNGEREAGKPASGGYFVIERTWRAGDEVVLRLPMDTEVVRWAKQGNGASVRRGPLWYSLKIGERWNAFSDNPAYAEQWPEHEVHPITPWNYALVLEGGRADRSFSVVQERAADLRQPFTPETAPVYLKARGRLVPEWRLERNSPSDLPPSPVAASGEEQDITLIPMGCARLRVSVFPVAE